MEGRMESGGEVEAYWEEASCGTTRATSAKHSLDYFEEIESFRYTHEPFIHAFAQFPVWHGRRVLEVGVGAGTDFVQWVRSGADAYGVDLTHEGVENTRKRLELEGLAPADLQVCDAEVLPFQEGLFDCVYSWGVIHHGENTQAMLEEIYRVTRPGGRVKIMVYNISSLWAWYMYLRYAVLAGRPARGRRWAIANHQESYGTKAYTKKEIVGMLGKLPHKDLQFYHYDQRVRAGAQLETARRVLQRMTPASMRWYLAFEFTKVSNSESTFRNKEDSSRISP